jgi:hypothetical protein
MIFMRFDYGRTLTGVDLVKLFWHKFTKSILQARSFYKNAVNISYVYKMV